MSGSKVVAAALVVALLGVWTIRSFVLDGSATTEPSSQATMSTVSRGGDPAAGIDDSTASRPVVATGDLAGVPVGYPASEHGAATAAVNWVASFPAIVRMGPIRLDDTLNTLLSERTATSGTQEVVTDYLALVDELGGDFASRIWIESPLQVGLADVTDTSANVAVWSMLVTGDPDEGPVEAIWRTHRIALLWERGDWRVDDVTITEGPTPVPNEVALPSPASEFVAVDGWEPAVFAATTTRADD